MQVELERLKATLLELAQIGFDEYDKGVYRLGFSTEDMTARNWLINLLKSEGFESHMDGAGNVFGRYGPGG